MQIHQDSRNIISSLHLDEGEECLSHLFHHHSSSKKEREVFEEYVQRIKEEILTLLSEEKSHNYLEKCHSLTYAFIQQHTDLDQFLLVWFDLSQVHWCFDCLETKGRHEQISNKRISNNIFGTVASVEITKASKNIGNQIIWRRIGDTMTN